MVMYVKSIEGWSIELAQGISFRNFFEPTKGKSLGQAESALREKPSNPIDHISGPYYIQQKESRL